MPDVAGHLFDRERTAPTRFESPMMDAFGSHCFYCGTHLPNNPIDHVLPWSLVGIDGLANLVLACVRCNGDKSGALIGIVDRVLDRDQQGVGGHRVGDPVAHPTPSGRGRGPRNLPGTATRCTDVVWVPAHGSARHQLSAQLVEHRVIRSPQPCARITPPRICPYGIMGLDWRDVRTSTHRNRLAQSRSPTRPP